MVSTRAVETPWLTRNSFTALARRAPKARLYSRVPRSSQWPSMVTRTDGYLDSQAAWRLRMVLSLSSTLYWSKAKWTVSPTLTRKSSALPGMMREVTGAGAGAAAGGGAGGGAVFTASCLWVQAPRIRAADRQANFRVWENRDMMESPGCEGRWCGRRPRL